MTSDLLQVLISHQPMPMLGSDGWFTQYLECRGRGCFFVTRGGDLMWDEFAQHQHDMITMENGGRHGQE